MRSTSGRRLISRGGTEVSEGRDRGGERVDAMAPLLCQRPSARHAQKLTRVEPDVEAKKEA